MASPGSLVLACPQHAVSSAHRPRGMGRASPNALIRLASSPACGLRLQLESSGPTYIYRQSEGHKWRRADLHARWRQLAPLHHLLHRSVATRGSCCQSNHIQHHLYCTFKGSCKLCTSRSLTWAIYVYVRGVTNVAKSKLEPRSRVSTNWREQQDPCGSARCRLGVEVHLVRKVARRAPRRLLLRTAANTS